MEGVDRQGGGRSGNGCSSNSNHSNDCNAGNTNRAAAGTLTYEIPFFGHQNIRSLHQKTIEITRETHLTPRGDCIVGVGAASGCMGLPSALKEGLRTPGACVTFTIRVGDSEFIVRGRGHPDLIMTHEDDIVIRRSSYICPRTLAVGCDKAAGMLPPEMVRQLRSPDAAGTFSIMVQ